MSMLRLSVLEIDPSSGELTRAVPNAPYVAWHNRDRRTLSSANDSPHRTRDRHKEPPGRASLDQRGDVPKPR
jgi:hypothetical protein